MEHEHKNWMSDDSQRLKICPREDRNKSMLRVAGLWYNQTLMVETNRVSGMYGTMRVELFTCSELFSDPRCVRFTWRLAG